MSSTVVAFVGNDEAADAVAGVAVALAALLEADVEAVHVGRAAEHTESAVASRGLTLHTLSGDATERIVERMSLPDVVAGVVGARRAPEAARPAGHVALGAIARVGKLLAVVPPDARIAKPERLRRVLLPLDGTETASEAVSELAGWCADRGVEMVVVHVLHTDTFPAFWDQAPHEAEAWSREFLARFCDREADLRLRSGVPKDQIRTVADEEDVDAVALSWSQVLAPGRAEVVVLMLSTTSVPLLLVPAAA